MKKLSLQRFGLNWDALGAIIPWTFISFSSLYFLSRSDDMTSQGLLLRGILFLLFIAGFLMSSRETCYPHDFRVRIAANLVQLVCVLLLYWLVPYSFVAILMVILSAQLMYYFTLSQAITWSPLWSVPLFLFQQYHWNIEYSWLTAVLFWTFNLFALITVHNQLEQTRAKEAAEQVSRELRATQSLLSEASRQAERTRIARNIHDLLGHHLTALTINLQVAQHHSQGEALTQIERCHAIAKLLLADVREAVSDLREGENIDLQGALNTLFENVPSLKISLNCPPDLKIQSLETAQTLLRCVQESITNTLKHSQATSIQVSLRQQQDNIALDISDNGASDTAFEKGNGLRGMEERVNELGGKLRFQSMPEGFSTHIEVPA